MDSRRLYRVALAAACSAALGLLFYHTGIIPFSQYATAHYVSARSLLAVVPHVAFAAMLEGLQRVDHVRFDKLWRNDYGLGIFGLSLRVAGILTLLLLPHALHEHSALGAFLFDRLYDFACVTCMAVVLGATK